LLLAAGITAAPPLPPIGVFALKNNVQWKATPAGTFGADDTMKITGVGINTDSNLHDTIGFKFKYTGGGSYQIAQIDPFYHTKTGNSLPLVYNKIDTAFDNYFRISEYDPYTRQVTCYFQVKFKSPVDTTTVTFLNGNLKSPLN
jgi:hypothetical protein